MGRDVRCHADRNTGRAVDKEVREAGGHDLRLLLRLIEVWHEVHGVLVDICHHLHGDFGQSRLGVSHGCSTVAVDGTEVAMAVHQAVAHGPGLCHIDQSTVDRAVPVRMVLAHRVADDTGALSVGLVRGIAQFTHCPEYSSLYRLQAVSDIRQRTGYDDAHRVIDIRIAHGLVQIHFLNSAAVKYVVVHAGLFLLTHPGSAQIWRSAQ